jgi:hypothetical protein
MVPVTREDGPFVLESDVMPILAHGDTLAETTQEFQEHFAYLWDSIAQQSDESLTPDAQATKRAQLNLVTDVRAAT